MQFWIRSGPDEIGPLTSDDVKEMAKCGDLKPNDQVSFDQKNWVPASKVKGFVFPSEDEKSKDEESDDEYRLAPLPEIPSGEKSSQANVSSFPSGAAHASKENTCSKCGGVPQPLLRNGRKTGISLCVHCQIKPGICPGCKEPLRTKEARQCMKCGMSWHQNDKSYAAGKEKTKARTQKNDHEKSNAIVSQTEPDSQPDSNDVGCLLALTRFAVRLTTFVMIGIGGMLALAVGLGPGQPADVFRPANSDRLHKAIFPENVRTEFNEVLINTEPPSMGLNVEFPVVTSIKGIYHFRRSNVVAKIGDEKTVLENQKNTAPWGRDIFNVGRDDEEDTTPTLEVDLKAISDQLTRGDKPIDLVINVEIEYPVRKGYREFSNEVQKEKRSIRISRAPDDTIDKYRNEYKKAWDDNHRFFVVGFTALAIVGAVVLFCYELFWDPEASHRRKAITSRFAFRSEDNKDLRNKTE